jgi:hypothetical protein
MRNITSFIGSALSAFALFLPQTSFGATPALPQLTEADFTSVIRDLTANTSMHSVTAPSGLGSIWGFEIGVVGGATSSPNLNRLVSQQSPGTEFKYLPHAGVLGAVTVPFGITVEATFVPKVTASGVDYTSYAAALKWNASEVFPDVLPLNVGIRGFVAGSEISFSQVINNNSTGGQDVNGSVKYAGQVTGLQLLASPKYIPVIEPYLGVGYLMGKGKIDVNAVGGTTLFQFTQAQSAESNPNSSQLLVGIDLRALILGFGLEYSRAFDTDSYTAKLSLKF